MPAKIANAMSPISERNTEGSPNDAADSSRPRRGPVSGTMARVVPRPSDAELPSLDAYPDLDGFGEEEEEEATRVSSPLRMLHSTDEESTGIYEDPPTRVMPAAESSEPLEAAHPATIPAPASASESASAIDGAPASRPASRPVSAAASVPSVVVGDDARGERTPDPLEIERALLRALTATAPRFVVPPVVAIRPAPPSPRMLAIVAGFTALGLLWVMAVCAMILVLVTR
jgi:hypothetical protein